MFFNTKEYPELTEFLRLRKEHPEFIEIFEKMDYPKVKPFWKLILPYVEKNPTILNDYKELKKTYDHIQKKKSLGKGFWDGSPTLVKGHVNAVISKNRLSIFNPIDNYNSLLKIRHFMHLMGIPISFDLKNPEKNWKHITQNVPVNTAMDAILWAEECLSGEDQFSSKEDFLIFDNSKADIYNNIYTPNLDKFYINKEKDIFQH